MTVPSAEAEEGLGTPLPHTDLVICPLCLGGNVLGWTADEPTSMRVLDAYLDGGGNFVDTADVYSNWVSGHRGGESETIIGRWLSSRGTRDRVVLATKIGMKGGMAPDNLRAGAERSLRRLRTDHIDLLYVHADDGVTPLESMLDGLAELVGSGLARHVAASNFTARRLAASLALAAERGLPRFAAFQAEYSLVEREEFERELREVCAGAQVAAISYFSLARGFLTGKYRPGRPDADTRRDREALDGSAYLHRKRAVAVLSVLEEIADARSTTQAAVALRWLVEQPAVVAAAASARNEAQLSDLLPMVDLRLSHDELARLSAVSSH